MLSSPSIFSSLKLVISNSRISWPLLRISSSFSSKIDYTKLSNKIGKQDDADKNKIDYSKVPVLLESDLEEEFVRGSGPGGQSVNKTANKVVLKHKITGLVVSCHTTRSLEKNRQEARNQLIKKLDEFYNKEDSIEAQLKRSDKSKQLKARNKRDKLEKLKLKFKEEQENQ
jgi:protein subunit release factor B